MARRRSSGSRNNQGAAHGEAEAAKRYRRAEVAAKRSRRAAEAAKRSHRGAEAAKRSRRTAEASRRSDRAAEAAQRSCHVAVASKYLSLVVEGSQKCICNYMRAELNKLKEEIAGWAKLQEESNASVHKATCVIQAGGESVAAVKRSIEDVKEIIAARHEISCAMDAMTKMAEERREEMKVVETTKELEEIRALQQPIMK
nr:uncharacterized protein LOC120967094 [Aegilops tauschii subsp. strangulata]